VSIPQHISNPVLADLTGIVAGWWADKDQCNWAIPLTAASPKRALQARDNGFSSQYDEAVDGSDDDIHGRAYHVSSTIASAEQRHRYIYGGAGLANFGKDFESAFKSSDCRGVAENL